MKLTYSTGLLIALISLFSSGCATINLPPGPSAYELQHYEDNVIIGVTQAADLRSSNKVGTVGLATFKIKSHITQLTSEHLMNHINKSLGFNVEQVASNDFRIVSGIVNSKIKEIKIFSVDAILQPVETKFILQIEVLNPNGESVFRDDFLGLHKETLGLSFTHEKEGRFIEAALINALDKLIENESFIDALNNL